MALRHRYTPCEWTLYFLSYPPQKRSRRQCAQSQRNWNRTGLDSELLESFQELFPPDPIQRHRQSQARPVAKRQAQGLRRANERSCDLCLLRRVMLRRRNRKRIVPRLLRIVTHLHQFRLHFCQIDRAYNGRIEDFVRQILRTWLLEKRASMAEASSTPLFISGRLTPLRIQLF